MSPASSLTLLVTVGFSVLMPARAAGVPQKYEDTDGRYAIDVPAGWASQDLGNGAIQFKGTGYESIQIGFIGGLTDRGPLCQAAQNAIGQSLSGLAPDGQIVDLEVNGNPARWGTYKGTVQAGGNTITLFALAGCVVLPRSGGGLFFMSILNQDSRAKLGATIQRSFESIRAVDATVTGATNRQVVVVPAAATASTAPPGAATPPPPAAPTTPFTHELVSLTLPGGWTVQPKLNNADPDMIAVFTSQELGANVVLAGGRKYGNLEQIFQKTKNSVTAAIPNAQPSGDGWELTTRAGDRVRMQMFTGSLVVNGKDIPMGALVAATRNNQRGLSFTAFFGTAVAGNGERIGREFGQLISSMH